MAASASATVPLLSASSARESRVPTVPGVATVASYAVRLGFAPIVEGWPPKRSAPHPPNPGTPGSPGAVPLKPTPAPLWSAPYAAWSRCAAMSDPQPV